MAYSEENGGTPFTMPVAPAYGYGGGNDFLGGNGAWWLIVLLLFCNNGWGFGGGGMMPWMMGQQNTNNDVQRAFDQSAVMNGINGLNTGMNAIAMNLQNCCCENRSNIADLKYTVATENCADRTALREVGTDLLMNGNNNTQRLVDAFANGIGGIMDKICQLELDAKNDKIAALQAELNEANRRGYLENQTAQILASQAAQTAALEQYLAPTPRPAYIVQNPNCCTQNYGCGCGCGQ